MLGKSAGAVVCGILLALSCAHNVGQDEHTGEDGRPKGARPLTLDNNEAKTKGIVTYPGGDYPKAIRDLGAAMGITVIDNTM